MLEHICSYHLIQIIIFRIKFSRWHYWVQQYANISGIWFIMLLCSLGSLISIFRNSLGAPKKNYTNKKRISRYLNILLTLRVVVEGLKSGTWTKSECCHKSECSPFTLARNRAHVHPCLRGPPAPWLHLRGCGPPPKLSLDVHFLVSPLSSLLLSSQWFSVGVELPPVTHSGHFCGWGFVVIMMGGGTLELRFADILCNRSVLYFSHDFQMLLWTIM